jgi:colanic acid/amylovoran biosynthesis glycosyltransferase
MQIAYLTPIYPLPSQTFIRREIAALEAHGFTIHRFTLRRFDGELVEPADKIEQGRTCAILDAGPWGLFAALLGEAAFRPRRWIRALAATVRMGLRSERGLIRHFIYLAEACWLRRRLASCGAQHIHAHFGSNSADIALLGRLLGGPPYSLTIHGPEDFDAPRSLSLRDKVHGAVFVAVVSEFTRSQLYRWCALEDWPKLHVIHCGVDAMFLASTTPPSAEKQRLVNVGRLSEQKGQLLLVNAAAQLRDCGLQFELVIVGDGPLRPQLQQLIDQLDLSQYVRISGLLSNQAVREELVAARALVLPSFAEGLPVVIMEAFALGRPAISTYVAGIPELVDPGVTGWLVPAGAIEPLVAAMKAALTAQPAELEQLGRAGRARVAKHHNAHTEAGKLAALFSVAVRPSPCSSASPAPPFFDDVKHPAVRMSF